ncbi:hypothetical protein, partial [Pseudomonas sp. SDO55104_S430]
DHVNAAVREKVRPALLPLATFVLHSLLFGKKDAVQIKHVKFTGDLATFGAISPRQTTFGISDQDKLLGYGVTHTFSTSPPTS